MLELVAVLAILSAILLIYPPLKTVTRTYRSDTFELINKETSIFTELPPFPSFNGYLVIDSSCIDGQLPIFVIPEGDYPVALPFSPAQVGMTHLADGFTIYNPNVDDHVLWKIWTNTQVTLSFEKGITSQVLEAFHETDQPGFIKVRTVMYRPELWFYRSATIWVRGAFGKKEPAQGQQAFPPFL